MGVYMGTFNFLITFPQVVNVFLGGYIVKYAFGGSPVYSLVTAAVLFFVAAFSALRIKQD